jgi:hypothetical protein
MSHLREDGGSTVTLSRGLVGVERLAFDRIETAESAGRESGQDAHDRAQRIGSNSSPTTETRLARRTIREEMEESWPGTG